MSPNAGGGRLRGLRQEYCCAVFEKIRNGPNGILKAWGKLIHKKPEVENLVALSI
jgi:hypothetical protein